MATIEEFRKFEFVVAQIKEAVEHPNADKLFVLKVDLGEENLRQIVAGIRTSYKIEELVGKKVVVIKNLEPAVIRGVESQGMILAATGLNGPIVVSPEKDVPIGSPVK